MNISVMLLVFKELLLGVILGFILTVLFTIFQLASQFFATQIGLGMSQVFDPVTQEDKEKKKNRTKKKKKKSDFRMISLSTTIDSFSVAVQARPSR